MTVGVLFACGVTSQCSSDDTRSLCSWGQEERRETASRFEGIDDVIVTAAADVVSDANDVYTRSSEEDSELWPTACVMRSLGVPGLLTRVLVFDDVESLDAYLQLHSFPAVENGYVGVRTGEVPSVAETAVRDVHGVTGANLYCLDMTACHSWILTRTFPSCAEVVVDLRYWVGTPSTTADEAADAMLHVSDTIVMSLREMGLCSPTDQPLPEYRGG